jgi:hypothetical protein
MRDIGLNIIAKAGDRGSEKTIELRNKRPTLWCLGLFIHREVLHKAVGVRKPRAAAQKKGTAMPRRPLLSSPRKLLQLF